MLHWTAIRHRLVGEASSNRAFKVAPPSKRDDLCDQTIICLSRFSKEKGLVYFYFFFSILKEGPCADPTARSVCVKIKS